MLRPSCPPPHCPGRAEAALPLTRAPLSPQTPMGVGGQPRLPVDRLDSGIHVRRGCRASLPPPGSAPLTPLPLGSPRPPAFCVSTTLLHSAFPRAQTASDPCPSPAFQSLRASQTLPTTTTPRRTLCFPHCTELLSIFSIFLSSWTRRQASCLQTAQPAAAPGVAGGLRARPPRGGERGAQRLGAGRRQGDVRVPCPSSQRRPGLRLGKGRELDFPRGEGRTTAAGRGRWPPGIAASRPDPRLEGLWLRVPARTPARAPAPRAHLPKPNGPQRRLAGGGGGRLTRPARPPVRSRGRASGGLRTRLEAEGPFPAPTAGFGLRGPLPSPPAPGGRRARCSMRQSSLHKLCS